MRSVDQILGSHDELTPDQLIPLLQQIQTEQGFLPESALVRVASTLHIPVSRVYGVATFYNQFRFAPLGEHVIEVCRGTACHVKQSLTIAQHVKRKLKLREDGNSRDNKFSMLTVACLGACSIAPVIKLDGEFYGHLTVDKLDRLLDELAAGNGAPKGVSP
jgi:NADH-quinone oxidoreductase subunit E